MAFGKKDGKSGKSGSMKKSDGFLKEGSMASAEAYKKPAFVKGPGPASAVKK